LFDVTTIEEVMVDTPVATNEQVFWFKPAIRRGRMLGKENEHW
jgi:hypothetical protein